MYGAMDCSVELLVMLSLLLPSQNFSNSSVGSPISLLLCGSVIDQISQTLMEFTSRFTINLAKLWNKIFLLSFSVVVDWQIHVYLQDGASFIWCDSLWTKLVELMAYHLFGAKPLPEPMLTFLFYPMAQTSVQILLEFKLLLNLLRPSYAYMRQ